MASLTMPHTLTRYSGFCELGIELQRCENTALRACAGLTTAQTGLMVKSVGHTGLEPRTSRQGPMQVCYSRA